MPALRWRKLGAHREDATAFVVACGITLQLGVIDIDEDCATTFYTLALELTAFSARPASILSEASVRDWLAQPYVPHVQPHSRVAQRRRKLRRSGKLTFMSDDMDLTGTSMPDLFLTDDFRDHDSVSDSASLSTSLPTFSPSAFPTVRSRLRRFTSVMRPAARPSSNNGDPSSFASPDTRGTRPTRPSNMQFRKKTIISAKSEREASSTTRAFDAPAIKSSSIFRNEEPTLVSMPGSSSVDMAWFDESEDGEHGVATLLGPPARRNRLSQFYVEGAETDRTRSTRARPAILVASDSSNASAGSTAANRVRYLPLCSSRFAGFYGDVDGQYLTVLPSHRARIDLETGRRRSPLLDPTWPDNAIPVELFELIMLHLTRDDVKSLRLTCREFERKVSRSFFYTSVVPFNTEIFDMIDQNSKSISRQPVVRDRCLDEAQARMKPLEDLPHGELAPEPETTGLQWQNAKDDTEGKVYKGHGLRVFQGFGPYIRRFGMSFEVSESQLANPPPKQELDRFESYFGVYNWSQQQYCRFDGLAGLERTADETSRMRAAFSSFKIVRELALTIDSGLGWLNGPDRSVRVRILDRPSGVFKDLTTAGGYASHEGDEFWNTLVRCALSDGMLDYKSMHLELTELPVSAPKLPTQLPELLGKKYGDTALWPSVGGGQVSWDPLHVNGASLGVLQFTNRCSDSLKVAENHALIPNDLKKEQKEWLLETEWAQRAFLESYMLAIIDNPTVFAQVSVLRLAKVSSRYLSLLSRESFWTALPNLINVTLHVSADWRTVEKDDAGFARTRLRNPSEAVREYHDDILVGRIATRESIKKVDIGWCGGGEHAEGIFARNNHVLPAPIAAIEHLGSDASLVIFPHVEHLTLTNCWSTPSLVKAFVERHRGHALKTLTLNSFSLCASPQADPVAPDSSDMHWTDGHRSDSWPAILDAISPGAVLDDYKPQPAAWEEHVPIARPTTTLQTLELVSCGYVKLHATPTDQAIFDAADGAHHVPSAWFRQRANALKPFMLEARDRWLGSIVQGLPGRELECLQRAWGLRDGWTDRTRAAEAEYDGFLPGGSGRVSGVVERGMELLERDA